MQMRWLIAVAIFVAASSARASDWNGTDTLSSIDGASGSAYRYDRTMAFWEPSSSASASPDQLIILFTGHPGPDPDTYDDFQSFAAGLGFHSITLDSDYGAEVGTDGSLDPGDICGCYDLCYDQLNEMLLTGNNHAGIPVSRYPVLSRIRSVVRHLDSIRPGHHWDHYVDGLLTIHWDKIILVGLSRGAELAAYTAKYNKVPRLLMFSGPNDSLHDPAGSSGGPATTFNYGPLNLLPACQRTNVDVPVHIIRDNGWTTNGTIWQTQRNQADSQMFLWLAEGNTHTWPRTRPVVTLLGLDSVTPELSVGDAGHEVSGWMNHNGHFLDTGVTNGAVCGNTNNGIHVAMLNGSCSGGDPTLRSHVWTYMLTHLPP